MVAVQNAEYRLAPAPCVGRVACLSNEVRLDGVKQAVIVVLDSASKNLSIGLKAMLKLVTKTKRALIGGNCEVPAHLQSFRKFLDAIGQSST